MHVYMYVCIYVYTCIHTKMYVYIYIYVFFKHVCMYACMYTCNIHVDIYECIHVCILVCVCACVCMCVFMHTFIFASACLMLVANGAKDANGSSVSTPSLRSSLSPPPAATILYWGRTAVGIGWRSRWSFSEPFGTTGATFFQFGKYSQFSVYVCARMCDEFYDLSEGRQLVWWSRQKKSPN